MDLHFIITVCEKYNALNEMKLSDQIYHINVLPFTVVSE